MAQMKPSPTTGELLVAHWTKERVAVRPSQGLVGIARLEQRLGLGLPHDFKSYLLATDGFAPPSDQDLNGFRFWPLNEVVSVDAFDGGRFASDDTASLVLFADYLGWSWGYALRAGTLGLVSSDFGVYMVGTADGCPRRVADSFAEFAGLYITDDARIYG
jgi:hypothetical protein